MTIRKKAIITLAVGTLIMAVSSIMFTTRLFNKKMDQLDNQMAKVDMQRVDEAINSEIENLNSKTADWSNWDDSYKFIQDKNKEYIKSNLDNSSSFESLRLSFMIFVNNKNQIVYEKGFSQLTKMQDKVPDGIHKYISKLDGNNYSGMIMLPEGMFLISARPIIPSSFEDEPKGEIIFGRYFDQYEVDNLTKITKQSYIKIFPIEDTNIVESGIKVIDDKNLQGTGIIKDVFGNPIAHYNVKISRDTYLQGLEGSRYLTYFLMAISTAFFIFTLWFLTIFVLAPIKNIVKNVNFIANSKDSGARITFPGSDEFGSLAKNINFMLEANEEMKKEIVVHAVELEESNKKLEEGRVAMLNILEDEKLLDQELKDEKKHVEAKVDERTKQLQKANEEINKGWLELQKEKSKLLASIEALLKAYVMIDLKGNITLTNHNLAELFGEVSGEWTLTKLQEKLGISFDIIGNYKECLKVKKRLTFKEVLFGSRFLEVRISPVFEDKTQTKLIGVLAIIGDVTEEKVLARSRDEFFSIASHELRTPLTAIKGNASMILEYYKEKLKPVDFKEMVDDIHDSSIRLIRIVNDFLDVSRLEQGRLEFKIDTGEVTPVIKGVIEEYQAQVKELGIYLKMEESKSKIPAVYMDLDRTRQVITNLIGNAIKFTKKGGITISVSPEKDFIKISVTDTGGGIPLSNQNLLFHKFQQAGSSILTRDTAHGTGLGLYISKLMVEGMGGTIGLTESIEGKGSTFSFTLPTKAPSPLPKTAQG